MAADVTITPANAGWTTTAGAQSGTVEGVTIATDNGLKGTTSGTDELRVYKNKTLTISVASTSVITKIVLNCTASGAAQYGPGSITAQTGYSYSGKVGTWTGEATSVSLVAGNNQVRATSIVVTVEAAPAVFTPVITGAAQFFDQQEVSITCGTDGASIYYTLDGTEPTASSAAYSAAFTINETKTVKAIAIKGSDKSTIASATFKKAPSYATFEELAAATLDEHTYVEVSFSNLEIDSIYLNSNSQRYGLYITVSGTVYEIYSNKAEVPATWVAGGKVSGTIRGDWYSYKGLWEIVPLAADWTWANINYTAPEGTPEIPTFSVEGGIYSAAQSVVLSCATEGAAIHYTLDGTDPTDASAVYSAPIVVSATTTIKAIAIKGSKSSIVVSETYIFPEGAGTKDNPYTCADVILINNALGTSNKYWVKGYILGGVKKSSGLVIDNTVTTAIAIADAADEADMTKVVPVQLGQDVRSVLAAEANRGKLVKVQGTLEAYLTFPGVKGVNAEENYELGGATAIDNTAAEVKAVKFFENGQLRIMKNGVVYNALGEIVR